MHVVCSNNWISKGGKGKFRVLGYFFFMFVIAHYKIQWFSFHAWSNYSPLNDLLYHFSICLPCIHCLLTVRLPFAHCAFTVCSLCVHCLLTVCLPFAHCAIIACSLFIYRLLTVHSLFAHSSFAHCVFIVCSPCIHCVLSVRSSFTKRSPCVQH